MIENTSKIGSSRKTCHDPKKNNLVVIRDMLGLSQAELGDAIGVSGRMIGYFESGDKPLPLENAMLLSDKYGVSLDQIYGVSTNRFFLDVRNLVDIEDGNVVFRFPFDYREYLQTKEQLLRRNPSNPFTNNLELHNKADDVPGNNMLATFLNSTQYRANHNEFSWEVRIPINRFCSMIQLGENKCTYTFDDIDNFPEPTEEQIAELKTFQELLKNSE